MASIRIYFESMAGTHLLDAIDALQNSGSASALYSEAIRATDRSALRYEEVDLARQEAHGRRMSYSRHALLFAAFAAEAYINDYLFLKVQDEKDRESLVRLPTLEKYILLPKFFEDRALFNRGEAPWSVLRWLFRRRDELVHAKPTERLQLIGEEPDTHNPRKAAESIVAVADSAVRLEEADLSIAMRVHRKRGEILSFGTNQTGRLPDLDAVETQFTLDPGVVFE